MQRPARCIIGVTLLVTKLRLKKRQRAKIMPSLLPPFPPQAGMTPPREGHPSFLKRPPAQDGQQPARETLVREEERGDLHRVSGATRGSCNASSARNPPAQTSAVPSRDATDNHHAQVPDTRGELPMQPGRCWERLCLLVAHPEQGALLGFATARATQELSLLQGPMGPPRDRLALPGT